MRRFFAALAAFGILFLASPGVLSQAGSALLACAAVGLWSLVACRPGRRAFLWEWAASGIGFSLVCAWSVYVWSGIFLFLAAVPGLYIALGGVLLRRLAPRYPLALAAPVAWIALDTLRFVIEPPFGFGWMRLGTHLHDVSSLAGAARVFGVGGLGFVIAAVGGGVADLLEARVPALRREGRPQASRWLSPLCALTPVALALLLAAVTGPAPMEPGPRVLLVQPAFEQHRKMEAQSANELFHETCAQTVEGLDRAAHSGEPSPDLIAWGETIFPAPLAAPDLKSAYEAGARSVAWARDPITPAALEGMEAAEAVWVQGVLFGRRAGKVAQPIVPAGASFLTGVEYYAAFGRDIRRMNAAVLWDARGERVGVGGKVHLVPGAEQLCGLERAAWVRSIAFELSGYVPDLIGFDSTQVLQLAGRDGRSWPFGVTVCFDNAFDGPYTVPLRAGRLDFHLVCSNEAWYRESFEYDQMVAFSRLIAIATGRSIVRATNAGVTLAIDPDGREIARLAVGGRDRMVAGALALTVPVPRARAEAPVTPYVRFEWGWLGLWIALPCALLALARRGSVTGRA